MRQTLASPTGKKADEQEGQPGQVQTAAASCCEGKMTTRKEDEQEERMISRKDEQEGRLISRKEEQEGGGAERKDDEQEGC